MLNPPTTRIATFVKENDLVAHANEDREAIAKQMVHYGLMTIPVVGDSNIFLGVIPSETLVDVLLKKPVKTF